jgi:hypothetical protein
MNQLAMKNKFALPLTIGLLIFVSLSCAAQLPNFGGKVVDENGEIILGANILIKGTPNGTVGDPNGEFKMLVVVGKSTLVVALIGYKTLEMEISIDADKTYRLDVIMIKDKPSNKKRVSTGKLAMVAKSGS